MKKFCADTKTLLGFEEELEEPEYSQILPHLFVGGAICSPGLLIIRCKIGYLQMSQHNLMNSTTKESNILSTFRILKDNKTASSAPLFMLMMTKLKHSRDYFMR